MGPRPFQSSPAFSEQTLFYLQTAEGAVVSPKEGFPAFNDLTALCNTCSHARDRHNDVSPHACRVKGCVCLHAWSFRIATYTGPDDTVTPPRPGHGELE
jgi:hypothetical protein